MLRRSIGRWRCERTHAADPDPGRAAAVGSGVLACVSLGFGIPAVVGVAHLLRTGRVWYFGGFPSYVFIVAGLTLNHAAGLFRYSGSLVERLTFPVYTALGLYALAVLLLPYRHLAWWAWVVTWVFVAVTGVAWFFLEPAMGWFYVGAAGALAVAQLLTFPRLLRGGG